jgi:hypothetical protein
MPSRPLGLNQKSARRENQKNKAHYLCEASCYCAIARIGMIRQRPPLGYKIVEAERRGQKVQEKA